MRRILLSFTFLICSGSLCSGELRADWLLENTHFVNVTRRDRLPETALRLGVGGYELAGGAYVDFRKWYEPRWIDVEFRMLTQLREDFGILWSLNTGEAGAKYRIEPGVRLGFIWQKNISSHASFSFSASRLFGGGFSEKSCIADYGGIGGVQTVNCRLAASELPPAETLKYLYRAKAPDWGWIGARYKLSF